MLRGFKRVVLKQSQEEVQESAEGKFKTSLMVVRLVRNRQYMYHTGVWQLQVTRHSDAFIQPRAGVNA